MKEYDKNAVLALLDRKEIPYHKQEHEAVHTMKDVDSSGVVREGIVLKNLFLKDAKGRRHFLVCVPETTEVDFLRLGEQLGAKGLGLASQERLEKHLGVPSGCVSPLNILNDEEHRVTLVLDAALPDNSVVGVHPNDSTASVWMEYRYIKQIAAEHGGDIVYLGVE